MSDEFVKVPFYVEKENGNKTFFLPDCRMGKGYKIGAKDKEIDIQNYWDALKKVIEMDNPRFRRRNKNGNFGIVTCKHGDVEEVSKSFIESERVKYGG